MVPAGLSSTVGNGIFVLLALVARETAGPAVVLSFLIASVAACLGGLCYSELSTRFPAGGASAGYGFAYATHGELVAWLIGWASLLDYSLGAALAAKAWTHYLDAALTKRGASGWLMSLFSVQLLPVSSSTHHLHNSSSSEDSESADPSADPSWEQQNVDAFQRISTINLPADSIPLRSNVANIDQLISSSSGISPEVAAAAAVATSGQSPVAVFVDIPSVIFIILLAFLLCRDLKVSPSHQSRDLTCWPILTIL